MSQRIALPTVIFDLADVSGIYDYGCYIAVEWSSPAQPAALILTGADAIAFRATGMWCGSLLDDLTHALRKSPLFEAISLQLSDAPESTIIGRCTLKTPITLSVDVASALARAWIDVPLVSGDGSSTCDLSVNSQRVELSFRMAHRDGGQVRGRIEVTGFATQRHATNVPPATTQPTTWRDDDPFA